MLDGTQPVGKLGMVFASSSNVDQRRPKGDRHNLQMSFEGYLTGTSPHQDLANQFKKQLQRNKMAIAANRSSVADQQQSFYNMKAQFGMSNLYSAN